MSVDDVLVEFYESLNHRQALRLSALRRELENQNFMKYADALYMRSYRYETWKKVYEWAFANLQYGKDFGYSKEVVNIGGEIYEWPLHFWLVHWEDVVALRLAIKLE